MALTDIDLRDLKPDHKPYQKANGGGLFVEVMPGGTKVWRMRYRRGGKQEKITLGHYPDYSSADARAWRNECKALVARGLSPMALKRGDPVPGDIAPALRDLAQTFMHGWCMNTIEKINAREAATRADNTVENFAARWHDEIVKPRNHHSRIILRSLERDVLPLIGRKQIADVSVTDILGIIGKIKNRGANQMALQTRNVLKRLFAYAITLEKTHFNPAAAIEARFIAQAKSRNMSLSPNELGRLLSAIYQSRTRHTHKLALHLLILCMVRKSEMIAARWEELDLENAQWSIPGERMKQDRPHLVPLARQAVNMFKELKTLANGSEWVFPSLGNPKHHIAKSTLNVVVQALKINLRNFVIHDFRRTASTHLNESGFNSDWIEKSLSHEPGGVRGVYNRAQYAEQRRTMLQWWADFVDQQMGSATD
ncbi:phage integrase [Betaproteobacteria bacterium]|nr:phage integrase [Betaproteobacteria bacterium]GHU20140.1 phage integrase [Betaproteobacteria bacterium]